MQAPGKGQAPFIDLRGRMEIDEDDQEKGARGCKCVSTRLDGSLKEGLYGWGGRRMWRAVKRIPSAGRHDENTPSQRRQPNLGGRKAQPLGCE